MLSVASGYWRRSMSFFQNGKDKGPRSNWKLQAFHRLREMLRVLEQHFRFYPASLSQNQFPLCSDMTSLPPPDVLERLCNQTVILYTCTACSNKTHFLLLPHLFAILSFCSRVTHLFDIPHYLLSFTSSHPKDLFYSTQTTLQESALFVFRWIEFPQVFLK